MDDVDRQLLTLLQEDASQSFAALGKAVGLSGAATHDRVRKLRERGVIRRTTIDVDPGALGLNVLAHVLIDSRAWMGDPPTKTALVAMDWIEEAHVIAGAASILVKVRTPGTRELQATLRGLHELDGVSGTQAIVVLETFFERPPSALGGE